MIDQALEQPRSLIFGRSALATDIDEWTNLVLLVNGEIDLRTLDHIIEVTEKLVAKAYSRTLTSASLRRMSSGLKTCGPASHATCTSTCGSQGL